jgi:hypothetical protein
MRKLGVLIAAALTVLTLTAPAAPAAQSAGWSCVADDVESNWTLLASGGSSYPFPHGIPPEGPKVITAWRVTVGPGLAPIRQRLEVFAIQNEDYEFKKLGESALETLVEGTNSFPTRIPVSEGNSVGLYGPEGTLFCNEGSAISWRYEGAAATGETKPFKTAVAVGTPVVVTVEDDRDNDGYGDETQDQCPSSALFHDPCPSVSIDARVVEKRRGAILIGVTTNVDTRIEVRGEAIWPRWGNTLKGVPKRIVKLNGGIQQMAPGVTAVFRVPLPKAVIRKLHKMRPRERLKLTMFVARLDHLEALPGQVTRVFAVKLPGRARRPAQR